MYKYSNFALFNKAVAPGYKQNYPGEFLSIVERV